MTDGSSEVYRSACLLEQPSDRQNHGRSVISYLETVVRVVIAAIGFNFSDLGHFESDPSGAIDQYLQNSPRACVLLRDQTFLSGGGV